MKDTSVDVTLLKAKMDDLLIELHEAIQSGDELNALECKDQLEAVRLELYSLDYFKEA